MKPDDVVTKMICKIQSTTIKEEEWGNVIKYMYTDEDIKTISLILKYEHNNEEQLKFKTFKRILLEFQLLGHER